jgi:hypothetical protein
MLPHTRSRWIHLAAGGLAACLLLSIPISLLAQPTTTKAPSPVTGLKVLSATIDPKTRAVTVRVQNTTDKTIVGSAVVYHEFGADNRQITPAEGAGMLNDYNGPDNPSHTGFILPGQIGTIRGYAAGPDNGSRVEATIVSVIFEDDSTEGTTAPAQMMFTTRRNQGKQAREQAAKETGARKAELERKAEWFEAHSPKEANQ